MVDYRDADDRPIISRTGFFLEPLKDLARRNGTHEHRNPPREPTAAHRHDQRANRRQFFENLEPHGALAGERRDSFPSNRPPIGTLARERIADQHVASQSPAPSKQVRVQQRPAASETATTGRGTGTAGTLPGQLTRSFALEGMVLGGAGSLLGAGVALVVSVALLMFPVEMPPPPGRSNGYPLQIVMDPTLYIATLLAMVALSMLASAWVARRTVTKPIVDALAHV